MSDLSNQHSHLVGYITMVRSHGLDLLINVFMWSKLEDINHDDHCDLPEKQTVDVFKIDTTDLPLYSEEAFASLI